MKNEKLLFNKLYSRDCFSNSTNKKKKTGFTLNQSIQKDSKSFYHLISNGALKTNK